MNIFQRIFRAALPKYFSLVYELARAVISAERKFPRGMGDTKRRMVRAVLVTAAKKLGYDTTASEIFGDSASVAVNALISAVNTLRTGN